MTSSSRGVRNGPEGRKPFAGRSRRLRLLALASLGVAVATSGAASEARPAAAERDRTVEVLDAIARAEAGFSLRAWVNDGSGSDIPIGHSVRYHFVADRPAHLTVLHVDSHGVATLIHPSAVGSDDALRPGVETTFPSALDSFEVKAEPPVGREYVLALATVRRISAEELGVSLDADPIAVVESSDAPALAERLRARYLALPASERASARFEQRIVGRGEGAEYASLDIVDYFTTRARSIRRPKLDVHVHFATGSDRLDETARRNLDAVADALNDPRLSGMSFAVSGHTDSVGEADYNEGLSERRARRVVGYLTEAHGVAPERLDVRWYGETRPIEPNDGAVGRAQNRRVEFELVR